MRDLSEEGFAVRTMMPLRAGEKTPFSFFLGEAERVEGEGEILWVQENGRVAGVRFAQISPADRGLIRDWLKRPAGAAQSREEVTRPAPPPAPSFQQLREEIHAIPAREETPEAKTEVSREQIQEPATSVMSPSPGSRPFASAEVAPQQEEAVKPIEPAAPSFQLAREEIQLLPAKEEEPEAIAPKPDDGIPEPAAPHPTVVPGAGQPSQAGAPNFAATEVKAGPPRVEKSSQPMDGPALPQVILPRADPAEEVPHLRLWVMETPGNAAAPAPLEPLPGLSEAQEQPNEPGPDLPDISTILMQPSGDRSVPAADITPWKQLPAEDRLTKPASPPEKFTLSTAVAIMLSLAIAVSMYVYHRELGYGFIWLGERMGGAEVRNSQPPPAHEAATARREALPAAGKDSQDVPGTFANDNHSSAPLTSVPKDESVPVIPLTGLDASSQGSGSDTGQAEFLQATQLLGGSNAEKNFAEAVRLLWIAVEKGNPGAEITLADMYWHGRGVLKNCDQARILLTAAARKGSAEGKRLLQQFQQEGCE